MKARRIRSGSQKPVVSATRSIASEEDCRRWRQPRRGGRDIGPRRHGPAIAGQVLIFPATDFAMTHPSHSEPETCLLLTHSVIRWLTTISATPISMTGAPRPRHHARRPAAAYVLTVGADPLRDEGDEWRRD